VSLKIAEVGRWKTTFDSTSGWVRVSEDNLDDERQILVASDTVLALGTTHSTRSGSDRYSF